MPTLHVELAERRYPLHIGQGLLDHHDLLQPVLRGAQAVVVSNTTVAPLYLQRLLDTLSRLPGLRVHSVILPDGERYKTLDQVQHIWDVLLEQKIDRRGTLIALGGGVIGDLTGMAAACYQRGIDVVQIPTTLLAQVDSSVGGKTGVNHRLGKNMIGAFHQPAAVLIDTDTLATLPMREFRAGLAEVIKYGLLGNDALFDWLEQHLDALLAHQPAALADVIARCCADKAAIVARDERETGPRALLNLGHTFGHAIETATGYDTWLHGEAVAVGMHLAAELSARLGQLPPEAVTRIDRLLARAGLPTQPPAGLSTDRFLDLMAHDKKVDAGRLRLVLLRAIGQAELRDDVPADLLRSLLESACTPSPA